MNLDKTILNICNKEYSYFLSKTYVNGVALGYKTINGLSTKEKCIVVLVKKKVPKHYLSLNNLIPDLYKGIITDVVEQGEVHALSLTGRIRPVEGGYSIGPAGLFSGGSYGCLVEDDNGKYMLSNNHLLALGNLAPIGSPILQPASTDGGSSPNDVVGTLDRFIPLKFATPPNYPENTIDCALAKIQNQSLVTPIIHEIGIPTGIVPPSLDLNVQMSCRSSEYLFGKIVMLGGATLVNISLSREALFIDQIVLDIAAIKGDSGALALALDNKAVGLLCSGSQTFSYCNPIIDVLNALKVRLLII